MKLFQIVLGASFILFTGVKAFPAILTSAMQRGGFETAEETVEAIKKRTITFDPVYQYVSNQGTHAFVPPNISGGDQRGPCPGLNAMANHNYIAHNGVDTITNFINACYQVYGMAIELGTVLSVFAGLQDGNGIKWSIGGPTPGVPGITTLGVTLLGTPQGIAISHNKYEADASAMDGDLYQYGNSYTVQIGQFEALVAMAPGPNDEFTQDIMDTFRASRQAQSIANNPWYFQGPPTLVFSQAPYSFVREMFSNKSAEHPRGFLDRETLKSFYSVTGNPGSFHFTFGYERIPDNWYKLALGDELTFAKTIAFVLSGDAKYPQLLKVGGNTGTVNSFTGLDVDAYTHGVYQTSTLGQGNNLFCLSFQAFQIAIPDLLKPLLTPATSILAPLNCPVLTSLDQTQLAQFPGAATTG